MMSKLLKSARLKKIIKLEEQFKSYLFLLRQANIAVEKTNTIGQSQIALTKFDEDLTFFRDSFAIILFLELLINDNASIGKEYYDNLRALEKYSKNHPWHYDLFKKFFPYHSKHPYFESLSMIDVRDLYSNDKTTSQACKDKIKHILYNPTKTRDVNNFTRGVKKKYRALKWYIEQLYRRYPSLCAVEATIRPIINLTDFKDAQTAPGFMAEVISGGEGIQKQLSNYAIIRKRHKVLCKQIAQHSVLRSQLVGYFWMLRHSALTGYFYIIILFFADDNPIMPDRLVNELNALPKEDNKCVRLYNCPDFEGLKSLIGGMELMDSYLKLKPVDYGTKKIYTDRIFGKAPFKLDRTKKSTITKLQNWQPL